MKKLGKKKLLIASGVTLAVIVGGWLAYSQFIKSDAPKDLPTATLDNDETKTNLNPATNEEKSEADKRKEEIAKQNQQSVQPSGKKAVQPVITYADRNRVSSYVPGIFEEGGTCTATFTKGSTNLTASSQGFADVNKTSCAPITPLNLSNGDWSVVVSYKSNSAEGSSTAYSFKVE